MRVLVCGDRNWKNFNVIKRELGKFSNDTVIIHGGAKGADTMAGDIGHLLGFDVVVYPARWNVYGRAAGPIRNQLMLDDGRPDMVLAFHNDIDSSRGTKDMVNRARKAGIKVTIIKEY